MMTNNRKHAVAQIASTIHQVLYKTKQAWHKMPGCVNCRSLSLGKRKSSTVGDGDAIENISPEALALNLTYRQHYRESSMLQVVQPYLTLPIDVKKQVPLETKIPCIHQQHWKIS